MNNVKVISDFNVEGFCRLFNNVQPAPLANATPAPYGQVIQVLAGGERAPDDDAFIWTRAEAVIPAFAKAVQYEPVDTDTCLAEVDLLAGVISEFAKSRRYCFVASWTLPAGFGGYGLLDWQPDRGLANLLAQMNLRLAERLKDIRNVFILDASQWDQRKPLESSRLWHATKVPFDATVMERAAEFLAAALVAVAGKSRKLILVDLDETLWGNTIGETGWQGIRLGGHDHVGEAFVQFQRALKALTNRGVQLGIVSKNDEAVALEALDQHPEMVLRRNDFAGWRINWSDKAQNVKDLADELRLGLESIVFIDDNPAERARVQEALPEVLVPDWPGDPFRYVSALNALRCFDTLVVSDEDRKRTAMYSQERARREASRQLGSLDDFLTRLDTKVVVEGVHAGNLPRVYQLFNKTNQLNLSTRRLTEQQIVEWASDPERMMLTVTVSDRFGESGLTGILGLEQRKDELFVTDFVMSCRVMGRGIEKTMLHLAVEEARKRGAGRVIALYQPTPRNGPTLQMLKDSGFTMEAGGTFVWPCARSYASPVTVTLTYGRSAALVD